MKKIIFICQGNICRSPVGEALLKYRLKEKGVLPYFDISSAGFERSTEGQDIDYRMKEILDREHIPHEIHQAHRLTIPEYREADLIVVMETYNKLEVKRLVMRKEDKVRRLLDFTSEPGDIKDPYYTLDFETAYKEINKGIDGLVTYLLKEDFN